MSEKLERGALKGRANEVRSALAVISAPPSGLPTSLLTYPGLRRLTPSLPWADIARPFRAKGKATNGSAAVGVRLGFQVASVEAAVSAVQQLGAEVAAPPAAGPWGWRAVVVDHQVEASQVSEFRP